MTQSLPAHALFDPHACGSAHDLKEWRWSYDGAGIEASGVLFTTEKPNAAGQYTVEGIEGQVNGVRITELFPAGQSIPNNAGYPIDNLISASGAQFDSGNGLGFALANGDYVNLYYKNGYYEVLTDASAFLAEPSITFSATPIGAGRLFG